MSNPSNRDLHDAIANALQHCGLTYSGIQEAVRSVQKLYGDHAPRQEETDTKLVYVKRWRTLVQLPSKYANEIVEALRAPAPRQPSRDDIIRAIEGRMVSFQGYSSPMLAAAIADAIAALAIPSTDDKTP